MKQFNIKQFSKEINFPYHTLLRIYNKYNCTSKEELISAIEKNKKFKVGDRFGKLTILSDESVLKNSQTHVYVECDCGNRYYVPLNDLLKNKRKSCKKCSGSSRRIPILLGEKYGD